MPASLSYDEEINKFVGRSILTWTLWYLYKCQTTYNYNLCIYLIKKNCTNNSIDDSKNKHLVFSWQIVHSTTVKKYIFINSFLCCNTKGQNRTIHSDALNLVLWCETGVPLCVWVVCTLHTSPTFILNNLVMKSYIQPHITNISVTSHIRALKKCFQFNWKHTETCMIHVCWMMWNPYCMCSLWTLRKFQIVIYRSTSLKQAPLAGSLWVGKCQEAEMRFLGSGQSLSWLGGRSGQVGPDACLVHGV